MGRGTSCGGRAVRRAAAVVAAALALAGCVVDLGTLGGTHARASGVARGGAIVGTSSDAAGFDHAFVWDPTAGQLRDLGTPGGAWSHASGVNDSFVVGWVDTEGFTSVGTVWSHDGRSVPLRHDGHDAGRPLAIDASGFIAGYLYDHATPDAHTGAVWGPDMELHTFAAAGGTAEQGTTARDVNGHLQAVGDGPGHTAFVWDPANGVRFLDPAGAEQASARAINDDGVVVGLTAGPAGATTSAAWNAATGEHRPVADLGGPISGLVDVNASGMAIGYTWDPDPDHPLANAYCVSLVTGRVTDLGRASATAINDDGVIVGSAAGRATRWSADTCGH